MYTWHDFPDDVGKVPASEGIYLLSESASDNGIIYVGRADDLNERLSQHPDPSNPCLQGRVISYFAYEIISSSESREEELIGRYDPPCNRTN